MTALSAPWPWYVAGPIIGLMVPLMLWIGSRSFGISQNLEHMVAMTQPHRVNVHFFKYNWRASQCSLTFAIGVIFGGFSAGILFVNPEPVMLSGATERMLVAWGFDQGGGLVPDELFTLSPGNIVVQFGAGILVGFGTRYASGCTSGHAITGLSTLQPQSLIGVIGIFAGGLTASHLLTPLLGS